ncbi:MAG: protein-glutamate O-methyltransferase CheR [Candidatus Heimdallarchaeota archaeon]|nr:MAG: protein-glutamate O-methyltransferase CheR [Candidatus Heimdallarchaeota archaeon]
MLPDQQLNLIKQYLYKRGCDISSYKDKYISRRLAIRMRGHNCKTYEDYYDILIQNDKEINLLKKSLSINVTKYFRDPDTWEEVQRILSFYVKEIKEREISPSLRIWSAGCAVGSESYSIASIVHHTLGNHFLKYDVKIYATDFNDELLQIARRGIYEGEILENIPKEFLVKYFEPFAKGKRVKYNIRKMVDYSYLDLLKDNYRFPKLNIIFCRNVIIYFSKEIQKEIFRKFDNLLVPNGFLILGRTEILPQSFKESFDVFSLRHRIYRKKLDSSPPPIAKKVKKKQNLKCARCGKKFDRLVDLRLHERKNSCIKYRCKLCPKKFDSEIRYRAHMKYFH